MTPLIKKNIIFGFFLTFLLVGNALLAQVNISVKLDKSKLMIGDQFTATVNISAPKGTTLQGVHYEAWKDEGVELLDIKPISPLHKDGSPQLLLQQEIKLTSFDTGYHRLPPLEVIYILNEATDTAISNNLGLEVMDLPVQEDAPIRDNKGIIKEARNWHDALPYGIGLLILLLLVGLGWWISKRKAKEKPAPPPPPPIPAHKVALSKLSALEKKNLWQTGKVKAFQSELTYIFREYLEKRFGLNALETTTTEIKDQLSTIAIEKDQQKSLINILETADMVKFAKAIPPEDIHAKALVNIMEFVENTKKEIVETAENKDTEA